MQAQAHAEPEPEPEEDVYSAKPSSATATTAALGVLSVGVAVAAAVAMTGAYVHARRKRRSEPAPPIHRGSEWSVLRPTRNRPVAPVILLAGGGGGAGADGEGKQRLALPPSLWTLVTPWKTLWLDRNTFACLGWRDPASNEWRERVILEAEDKPLLWKNWQRSALHPSVVGALVAAPAAVWIRGGYKSQVGL